MKLRDLMPWVAVLIVPAVPVFAFYLVFKELNSVEVSDLPTGVAATGPIAAYFVLLWFGSRLLRQTRASSSPLSPAEEELVGTDWSFEASSQHSARDGKFSIGKDDRGRLSVAGSFKLDGRDVGGWKSTMAHRDGTRFQFLYELTDAGKGNVDQSTGLLSMMPEPGNPDTMTGTWGVVGNSDAHGALRCTRIRS